LKASACPKSPSPDSMLLTIAGFGMKRNVIQHCFGGRRFSLEVFLILREIKKTKLAFV